MTARTAAALIGLILRSSALAEERPPVQIDQGGCTLQKAVQLFNDEFYIPMRCNDGSPRGFHLLIDEVSAPRAIAELCRQAPAGIMWVADDKVNLELATCAPLARLNLEDGSVYLLQQVTSTRSHDLQTKSVTQNLTLQGVLLTDGDRTVFGVATFIDVKRYRTADGWHDVPANEPARVSAFANQIAWLSVAAVHTGDARSIIGIEGVIQTKRINDCVTLSIRDVADLSRPHEKEGDIEVRRERPDTQANELAVLVARGPLVKATADALSHPLANRFVDVFDAAGQRINDRVEIDAKFINGEMIVRVKSIQFNAVDRINLWWPKKLRDGDLQFVLDPLPTEDK